jgi:hypothetical protein
MSALPLIFFLMERSIIDRKKQELFFDLVVCAITLFGAANFSVLAWKEFPEGFDFSTIPLQARGVVERVERGQIPFPSLGTILTPLALTPVGFSVRIVKIVTGLHALIFLSTLTAVFLKTRSDKCVGGLYNSCEANLVHDIGSYSLAFLMAFFGSIQGAEIQHQSLSSLRHGRNADSVCPALPLWLN